MLLTAGPVPISPVVGEILRQPIIYHRGTEFIQSFKRVAEGIKYLFQTEHDGIILTAIGTGAMEATITNLFTSGESVIVVENGKFSERWSQIAEIFGLDVKRIKIPWGKSVTIEELSEVIQDIPSLKAIFLTYCETSTGALTDLETITAGIRELTPALIIVDAISSAGSLPLKMDEWTIDVAITASQKALGLPPGLAFVALNRRVWQHVEQAELPRYYFDFTRARQALRSDLGSPFTPAIPLILAADYVLKYFQAQGLEKIWQAQKEAASRFREKIITSGLFIFPEVPADSLTVIRMNPALPAEQIVSRLRVKYGITVSNGQGQLFNKVIRIGHFTTTQIEHLHYFLEAWDAIISGEL